MKTERMNYHLNNSVEEKVTDLLGSYEELGIEDYTDVNQSVSKVIDVSKVINKVDSLKRNTKTSEMFMRRGRNKQHNENDSNKDKEYTIHEQATQAESSHHFKNLRNSSQKKAILQPLK